MMTHNQPECNAIRDQRRPCKIFVGPKLYCDCGCMDPTDLVYDLANVVVSGRSEHGYADYVLSRAGVRVGEVNTQYGTIVLDGVEYLEVSAMSPMYQLVIAALSGNIPRRATCISEVMTYAELKDTNEQDQDDRCGSHPGYCRECHTYCYGDCQS